jgi:hypothetical protein
MFPERPPRAVFQLSCPPGGQLTRGITVGSPSVTGNLASVDVQDLARDEGR